MKKEIELLRAEVKKLQARIEELEAKQPVIIERHYYHETYTYPAPVTYPTYPLCPPYIVTC